MADRDAPNGRWPASLFLVAPGTQKLSVLSVRWSAGVSNGHTEDAARVRSDPAPSRRDQLYRSPASAVEFELVTRPDFFASVNACHVDAPIRVLQADRSAHTFLSARLALKAERTRYGDSKTCLEQLARCGERPGVSVLHGRRAEPSPRFRPSAAGGPPWLKPRAGHHRL